MCHVYFEASLFICSPKTDFGQCWIREIQSRKFYLSFVSPKCYTPWWNIAFTRLLNMCTNSRGYGDRVSPSALWQVNSLRYFGGGSVYLEMCPAKDPWSDVEEDLKKGNILALTIWTLNIQAHVFYTRASKSLPPTSLHLEAIAVL